MSAAVYLDLESGAQRIALRHGERSESELLGTVNSGDPENARAVPAVGVRYLSGPPLHPGDGRSRHHGRDSVVGRPPFDAARLFAICDDRATNDAIELHELSATLKAAFPADGLAASRDARVRHVRDAVHGGRLRAARASRSAGGHPAGRVRDRRSASPLAVRAPPAALAADRGRADRERHADMEVSSQSPGIDACAGNGRLPRGPLRIDREEGLRPHRLGHQPGGARSGCTGARYVQRGLPPVAEQRGRLARARTCGHGSHGCPDTITELRPR